MAKQDLIDLLDEVCCFNNSLDTWIYGAGDSANLYYQGLVRGGYDKIIKGFCVDSKYRTENTFHDMPLVDIDSLSDNFNILICSFDIKSSQKMYETACKYTSNVAFLDEYILKANKENVLNVYDMLQDTRSKQVYENVITARVKAQYPVVGTMSRDMYFCWGEFSHAEIGGDFIDCGAYIGDTIESFLFNSDGRFNKIIAFEPNTNNIKAINYRLNRLKNEWNIEDGKIEIVNAGVSDTTELLCFDDNGDGLGSKFVDGADNMCQTYAIDDIVKDKVSFIKADIESFEYKALCGARKTIEIYKPVIAICLYHSPCDLYDVPILLKSICPDYKFSIRHHGIKYSETILYAWVD